MSLRVLRKCMRGMRSQAVRGRLQEFASSHRGRGLEIVSYDVAGHDNATAVAVAHFIFGTTACSRSVKILKEYRYPGLIEKPGVVWLGQSVFLLIPDRSSELRAFLVSKGVAHGRLSVRVG